MEGRINMSAKIYDSNVAGEVKASFAVLLNEATTLAFLTLHVECVVYLQIWWKIVN